MIDILIDAIINFVIITIFVAVVVGIVAAVIGVGVYLCEGDLFHAAICAVVLIAIISLIWAITDYY